MNNRIIVPFLIITSTSLAFGMLAPANAIRNHDNGTSQLSPASPGVFRIYHRPATGNVLLGPLRAIAFYPYFTASLYCTGKALATQSLPETPHQSLSFLGGLVATGYALDTLAETGYNIFNQTERQPKSLLGKSLIRPIQILHRHSFLASAGLVYRYGAPYIPESTKARILFGGACLATYLSLGLFTKRITSITLYNFDTDSLPHLSDKFNPWAAYKKNYFAQLKAHQAAWQNSNTDEDYPENIAHSSSVQTLGRILNSLHTDSDDEADVSLDENESDNEDDDSSDEDSTDASRSDDE